MGIVHSFMFNNNHGLMHLFMISCQQEKKCQQVSKPVNKFVFLFVCLFICLSGNLSYKEE